MTTIHINWVKYSRAMLKREDCPICNKRTFFVSFFQDWYGWDSTCIKCGDSWQDGHRLERPFMRGWRKQAIKDAKKDTANGAQLYLRTLRSKTMTNREAFEAHFIERFPRWKKKRRDSGCYINIKASIAYDAWQARQPEIDAKDAEIAALRGDWQSFCCFTQTSCLRNSTACWLCIAQRLV